MSRAKARALVDDGRRGAKQLVRLTENPQGFLNPVLLLVLDLPTGGGHPGRHPGLPLVRRLGRGRGHRVRDRGHLRARRGGAQELGRAPSRSGPPCSAPRWCRPSSASGRSAWCRARLIGLANLLIGEKGQYLGLGGDRVRAAGHGRRGRRGGRDRNRGAGPHPFDHRVRRHRGTRGDGPPSRHGDHRGRRTGRGGARAGPGGRLQPDAGGRAPGRRRGGDRLHQGHDPHGAIGHGAATRSGPTSGSPTSSPRPNGCRP